MNETITNIEDLGLTTQRKVVLRAIRESTEHLTPNEIFESARSLLPGISFATVYNSLRFLKEAGHIAEKNFGNGGTRYDRITSRHDHALCTQCGKLIDMTLELPEELVRAAAKSSNFAPESIEVILRGLCPDCEK